MPTKSEHPLELLLRHLELRSPLAEPDRQAIRSLPFNLRTLEAGSYIVREAEPPKQCGVLVTGFAYRQKLTGEGMRQIIALCLAGDALDFQNLFLDLGTGADMINKRHGVGLAWESGLETNRSLLGNMLGAAAASAALWAAIGAAAWIMLL